MEWVRCQPLERNVMTATLGSLTAVVVKYDDDEYRWEVGIGTAYRGFRSIHTGSKETQESAKAAAYEWIVDNLPDHVAASFIT